MSNDEGFVSGEEEQEMPLKHEGDSRGRRKRGKSKDSSRRRSESKSSRSMTPTRSSRKSSRSMTPTRSSRKSSRSVTPTRSDRKSRRSMTPTRSNVSEQSGEESNDDAMVVDRLPSARKKKSSSKNSVSSRQSLGSKSSRGRRKREVLPVIKCKLTDEERGWFIALEETMRSYKGEDFGRLTDFDLVSHALVAKDQPQTAIHRMRRLKAFQQAYKIADTSTVYEAIKIVQTFVDTYPEFIQAFGKDSAGRWVINYRLEQFFKETSGGKPDLSVEQRYRALYYIFLALQPDLDAMRNGTVWIGELEGVSGLSLPIAYINGARALCRDSYPIKVKDAPCLNPPSRFSAMYALCRPFVSPHVFEKLVGTDPFTIRKVYSKQLMSRNLGGTQKSDEILDILEENLRKRFDNHETFKSNILL